MKNECLLTFTPSRARDDTLLHHATSEAAPPPPISRKINTAPRHERYLCLSISTVHDVKQVRLLVQPMHINCFISNITAALHLAGFVHFFLQRVSFYLRAEVSFSFLNIKQQHQAEAWHPRTRRTSTSCRSRSTRARRRPRRTWPRCVCLRLPVACCGGVGLCFMRADAVGGGGCS
jgi:hypothetical protein